MIKHYGVSVNWIVNPKFSLELNPLYTSIIDGRKLYTASLTLNYHTTKSLVLKLYGFTGEHSYYYDEDLLTMFNRNETQNNLDSFILQLAH